MTAPIGASTSRFRFESHDHSGNFLAALPYRNAQGEFMLGVAGAQMRCEIPYRGYSQVTRANLAEGKHELWVYDNQVSGDPIFAGPIWDITPGSDTGVLQVSAQDPLSYTAKRLLKSSKTYSNKKPEFMMDDLMTYANSQRAWPITTSTPSASTKNSSPRYKSIERNRIIDLLDSISQMGDGVDYYVRNINGSYILYLYGGKIKPTAKPYALEYGGALDGYSVQFNAQSIANDYDVVSSNGRVGNAVDASKQTEYNALYQAVDIGSELTSTTSLNDAAATGLKKKKSSKTIPTIVTRVKTPIKDFDFGDQFLVVINDYYVQVNVTIRVIGWQITIGQGDKITTVIYTKDTEEVT